MISNNSEISMNCMGQMARLIVIIPYSNVPILRTATLLTCIVNCLVCPLTVLGNVLVFVAILRKAELRNLPNTSLLLQALTDLSVGLIAQPAFVVFQVFKYEKKRTDCVTLDIYTTLLYICIGLSFLTLTAITMERYLAIFRPYWYVQHVSKTRVIATVLGNWAVWVVFTCSLRVLPYRLAWPLYRIVPSIVVPAAFITAAIVYWKVFKLSSRKRASVRSQENASFSQNESTRQNPVNLARETKTSKTISLVTGSLFLCYAPLFCFLAAVNVQNSLNKQIAYHVLFPLAETALFLNSFLNPLIYVWRTENIRSSLRQAIGFI